MTQDALSQFLLDLSSDATLRAAFTNDPHACIGARDLTPAERVVLQSGRADLVRQAVDPEILDRIDLRHPFFSGSQDEAADHSASPSLDALTVVGTGIQLNHVTPQVKHLVGCADIVFYLLADECTKIWIRCIAQESEDLYVYYEEGVERFVSYCRMIDRILEAVRAGQRVCVATYGHPGVFAFPTHESVRRARAEGFRATMLPAISAEDCLFAELGIDPGTSGCQSFEATDFMLFKRQFDPRCALVLWQIGVLGVTAYTRGMPANKLATLANYLASAYGPEHKVTLYEAPQYAICDALVETLPIRELPHSPAVNPISTLYVPGLGASEPDPEMLEALGLELKQ